MESDSGMPNLCKFDDQCKSKVCNYNHTSRPVCRDGDTCIRSNCWYNHEIQLCGYGIKCTNKVCKFRHPTQLQEQLKPSTSSDSPSPTPLPIDAFKNQTREIKPCRFGDECRNGNCQFKHANRSFSSPSPSTVVANSSQNEPKILPLCKFQNNCTNPGCKFTHIRNQQSTSNEILKIQPPLQFHQEIGTISQGSIPNSRQSSSRSYQSQKSETFTSPSFQLQDPKENLEIQHQPSNGEIRALQNHELQIKLIRDQIIDTKCSPNFDIRNKKTKGTIEALEKQLSELTLQQLVFQEMRSRAIESCTKEDLRHQLKRELFRFEHRLPALAKRSEIEKHIEKAYSRFLIIQGQTGSGKSTQIVQYIADHPKFKDKKVVCTQPRKIAAVNLANRVSFEYSGGSPMSKPGHQIGYHVGGRKVGGDKCRIEFVTEGIMLERIMKGSPEVFKNIGCIVIDEAHERSIICDILLGSFKKNDPRWKDILIVVTSATIDLVEFSKFFNNAPTIEIEGRTFPVDINYKPVIDTSDIKKEVVQCAMDIHTSCQQTLGDILCFLPGQEDVLLAKETFDTEISKLKCGGLLQVKVFALYGKQEPEEQAKVFEKLDRGTRKIIFATDVAETSITIDGVVYVVDSGVKKEMIFDPKRNISSLKVNTISISSAIQRAGRSGRTQPGECTRLYSEEDFEKMNISTAPEIFRRPLSLAILSLREMNLDPVEFDWITAPSKEAIAFAEEELYYLKAVDAEKKPTELGKLISESQQEPKLVRMIYQGCQKGFGVPAVTIASILTVSNMFFWNGNDVDSKAQAKKSRQNHAQAEGDIVTMYRLFEQWLDIRQRRIPGANASDEPNSSGNDSPRVGTPDDKPARTHKESESSEVSAAPEGSKETEPKKNSKKAMAEWCRNNFINGKAMALAASAKHELITIFKHVDIWKQNGVQTNVPSNTDIQRLVLSGYFLNSARLIHSKGTRTHQYYAVHSEVVGNLDYRSALVNHGDANEHDRNPPSWIVFDKILRLASTLFPVTSPINESWIEEESQEFHALCISKSHSLPTEKILKQTSPEILRTIFGKYFANFNSLETELSCSLDVDVGSGILAAYCSSDQKSTVDELLSMKIQEVTKSLINQVNETDYIGGTRVVVGEGYEVKEILFPQEYTTLCIRKLPSGCTKKYLTDTILNRLSLKMDGVRFIEVIEQESNFTAVIKFFTKQDAKIAFETLKGEMIKGQLIDVIPTGLGPKRGVTQGETCRLKISWALGYSSQKANIAFSSPIEANNFIERVSYLLPGARVTRVHGELQSSLLTLGNTFQSKKPLPPTTTLVVPKGHCRFRFAVNHNKHLGMDLEYKVTVVDLRQDIDEFEIFARVKPAIPKWVKVDRVVDPEVYERELLVEERTRKLEPIQEFITEHTVTTDFFDKNLCKAGIYVYFDDKLTIQKAYRGSDYYSLGNMFGQPHRKEIEYTHATSVHSDLHKYLKPDIDAIKDLAWKKGVNSTEFAPKNKSGFVMLKFRSCNTNAIREIQEKLEEISNCTKFICENIELLFTWTGRKYLVELGEKTFVHWNNRTNGIWIYGNPEIQKEVVKDLQRIVETLKCIEVFDKPIMLNKKKIDLKKNKSDESKIGRLCKSSGLDNFHFIGNTLFASGSKATVENFEKELESSGNLFVKRPSKISTQRGIQDCGLCCCPIDKLSLLTSVCGHAFCIECIQPMFDVQPLQFPVVCPQCQKKLVINDISRCATQSKLRKFLEHGVFEFQKQNHERIFICPNPGCNQLLSYDARRTGEHGGEFLFCDECVTTYCMPCSMKLEKPIKSHDYESCNDVQNGPSDEVKKHVKEIQEKIFNLSCPRCNVVFFDFTGCAAVVCESCKCGFCGICLEDCGNDAHSHVRNCSKNPNKGDFFISETQLNQIHKNMRVLKFKSYFEGIKSPEVRNDVYRGVRRDLIDLGLPDNGLVF